jgi:hypothetical protein
MNAWTKKKSALTLLLLGGVFAAAVNVEAKAPWFAPGGFRPPQPPGAAGRGRAPEHERERRSIFGEQRFVRQLYQGFLNRQPSAGELRDWTDRLGRDANPTELVQEFMDSDEFFVRQTYRGLLGREPEPAGLQAHMRALEEGQSRAEVVESFLASEEFRRRLGVEPRGRRDGDGRRGGDGLSR